MYRTWIGTLIPWAWPLGAGHDLGWPANHNKPAARKKRYVLARIFSFAAGAVVYQRRKTNQAKISLKAETTYGSRGADKSN